MKGVLNPVNSSEDPMTLRAPAVKESNPISFRPSELLQAFSPEKENDSGRLPRLVIASTSCYSSCYDFILIHYILERLFLTH